jgi:large subunit ribosomal protein L19
MAKTKVKSRRTSLPANFNGKGLFARVATVEKAVARPEIAAYKAGDTVKVHVKIKEGEKERVQVYEGLVIARSNRGVGRSLTVRKISHGVGVERIFLEASPKVAKIEIVSPGVVRRAKLYYVRKLEGKAARIEREE